MKNLLIPFIGHADKYTAVEEISSLLDLQARNAINEVPWPDYSYKPEVTFAAAYTRDALLLKYYVKEAALKAIYRNINDPVYKDSCVEFFIAFGNENRYYNLEFNCLGTCLMAFGPDRHERKLLPAATIGKIRSDVFIKSLPDQQDGIYWELTLVIPLDVFIYHQSLFLKDQAARANFYKCGDELPEPHFLAWNNINSEQPDFHLPQFFGSLYFG